MRYPTAQPAVIDKHLINEVTTAQAFDGQVHFLDIDGIRKRCLLGGLGEIELALDQTEAIGAYELCHHAQGPWLFPSSAAQDVLHGCPAATCLNF